MMIAAALAFTAAAPAAYAAPEAPVQGTTAEQREAARQTPTLTPSEQAQCRGPDGKDAVNAKCKGAGPAPAAVEIFKRDAQGQCRDANGKVVASEKCKLPS